jgi:glycosyltransferase involved in cell wall biosynthesis
LKSLRLWLYERFYRSRVLRSVYMASSKGSASRGLTIGKPLAAARGLLMGWRHAGEDRLGAGGRDLWQRILAHAQTPDGAWRPVRENPFLAAWAALPEAAATRARFAAYPPEDRVRLRIPRAGSPAARPGDLVVLKEHDPATGEAGVLLVTYHDAIGYLPQVFDLAALAPRYQLVLEPSTWGYMDERFLPYLGADLDVVVESQSRPDFAFVEGLRSNLVPSRLGAGDWVDPALFAPKPGTARAYDVAMVAAWDPLKRHGLLLDVLARLKRRGRVLKAALIGYAWTWDRAKVERLVERRGLADQVTFFEKVPHAEVARVLSDSRVSVLLSRREGANRAIYESWFCDTPTIVYRRHRGVNLDHAGEPRAGLLAEDGELEQALLDVVDGKRSFAPRAWALEHTGCHVALARLEAELRALAERRGRPWTRGLAPRFAGGYLHEADRLRLAAEYDRLAAHLRPA